MKVSTKWIRICNLACAVLLIALLVCQFLPFWTMPACTCTGACEPAANKFSDPKVDPTCEACLDTYKLCKNLDRKYQAGTDETKLKDTSKEWTVSIQQYTWLPSFECCKGVTEHFARIFDDPATDYEFMVNDIKNMPFFVFAFCVVGIFCCIRFSKKPLCTYLPLGASIAAIIGYLSHPIFQMGMMWQVHLVVAVLVGLVSLVNLYECLRRSVVWLDPRQS